MRISTLLRGLLPAVLFAMPLAAAAQGELVVYCTVQEEWCRPMVAAFEKATGIKVLMTRKSSGEFYAQLKAEAVESARRHLVGRHRRSAPAGGRGRADRAVQVAEDGRAAGLGGAAVGSVEGPHGRRLRRRARLQLQHRPAQEEEHRAEPKCWSDLIKPAFKDEIQVANPNSSGTSYTMLATLVQLMGEDKAFDYLKALHKNVNQYTKSGAAPARAAATGESLVGITFQHDAVVQAIGGAPVKIVSPCEGTGYEIGSMSIIKGAKNMENAKKWYDWALTPEAQSIGAQAKVSYQVPSNKNATRAAAGAEVLRDQAHQLRLREVRLVGRAHAPADEVGQGSLDAAEVSVAARRGSHRARAGRLRAGGARSRRSVAALIAAVAARCARRRSPWVDRRRRIGARPRRGRRQWPRYARRCALGRAVRRRRRDARRRAGCGSATRGTAFAAGARPSRGRSARASSRRARAARVRRRRGARARRAHRLLSLARSRGAACSAAIPRSRRSSSSSPRCCCVFIFYPVGKSLLCRGARRAGQFRAAARRRAPADRGHLGLGLLRRRHALRRRDQFGAARDDRRRAVRRCSASCSRSSCSAAASATPGLLKLMSILPIITPPFVIALALVVLFGRTGLVTGWLDAASAFRARAGSTACRA